MTSKIITVYNRIRTLIPTLTGFNDKFEIPIPENLVSNPIVLLKNGWGVIIGEDSPSINQEFRFLTTDRRISIVLTRDVFQTFNNAGPSVTVNKNLLEDSMTIIKTFLKSDQINIEESILKVDYSGSSPIEFLVGDNARFRAITIDFRFNINEMIENC